MGDIIETLQALPYFCSSNGASEERISKAEAYLGVTFSEEYRTYLKAFGDASANGHELTGISDNERIDVVSATEAERTRNPDVPDGYYAVEHTGIDRIVVWQDSSGAIYQTVPGRQPEVIFKSLSEYVAS